MGVVNKIMGFLPGRKRITEQLAEQEIQIQNLSEMVVRAQFYNGGAYTDYTIGFGFNGEKNVGELGPVKDAFAIDYSLLRARSWQAYLDSDIAKIVVGRYKTWVNSTGLKLKADPKKELLPSLGDAQVFSKNIEALFSVYAESKLCDYAGQKNLRQLTNEVIVNKSVGGDLLVVLRYDSKVGLPTIQLIDGVHVKSIESGTDYFPYQIDNGNRIIHGVEVNMKGEHVAYWIQHWETVETMWQYERIPAKSSSGLQMAFLVYGTGHRIDNYRGLPLLSVVLETITQLDRYKSATIGSAEERQKVPYFAEHKEFSTGDNVLQSATMKAYDTRRGSGDVAIDEAMRVAQNKFAATYQKQFLNMPIGSALKSLESKNELHFKEFFDSNGNIVCSAMEIPPEVAFQKYDSNYSASRGAMKDWENTLNVQRVDLKDQFLQNVYNFFLEVMVRSNKVQAYGYTQARDSQNVLIVQAYRKCRFIGVPVPHIDPLKEVQAVRLAMGLTGGTIPLMDVEAAIEQLGGGEVDATMEQFAKELQKSKDLGIIIEPEEVDPISPEKPL